MTEVDEGLRLLRLGSCPDSWGVWFADDPRQTPWSRFLDELAGAGYEDGFFVGPTLIDQVTPEMDVYREEIFGPVLSVVRMDTVDDAIKLINSNPYGNGTAIFTGSGEAARTFQRGVKVGMIGINVPVPVPMAYYSFGGWKDSLFGQSHIHGPEGVQFYTRAKVVTQRWPHVEAASGSSFHFPTST